MSTLQSIKHWPSSERPRERLLNQGASSLSDAELLAIFLRSGSKQHSAVELARLLLQHFGGLQQVLNAEPEAVCAFHGMGSSKYAHLLAAKELGRRYLKQALVQVPILDSPERLWQFLSYELQHYRYEVFAALVLDADLRFIDFKILFEGQLNGCLVSINRLMSYALKHHATHLVVAHTHPHSLAIASKADEQLTEQIRLACQLLEIQFIDHLILSQNDYYSFAAHQRYSVP